MRRPEFGALMGAAVIYLMFSAFDSTGGFVSLGGTARWTDVAATTGIMAVMVSLLMIGGEFDLSAGVMIGSSGLFLGLLVTKVHMNLYLGVFLTLLFGAGIGLLNGYLVTKTKLPSFIVTLATFFVLRGFNLGFTQLWTGTVRVDGLSASSGYKFLFRALATTVWAPYQFNVDIFWWFGFIAVASWALAHSQFGSWVAAVGGDQNAARNSGVPVKRTKIILFTLVSLAASFVGIMEVIRLDGMQAGQGVGDEFTFIIAAVVGGTLLTGGFGSIIGAAIGGSIIGIAFIGISYANWNTDWNYAFLGAILFAAVSVNTVIRRRAERASK
jgi:simple sugar transport system permease protein